MYGTITGGYRSLGTLLASINLVTTFSHPEFCQLRAAATHLGASDDIFDRTQNVSDVDFLVILVLLALFVYTCTHCATVPAHCPCVHVYPRHRIFAAVATIPTNSRI